MARYDRSLHDRAWTADKSALATDRLQVRHIKGHGSCSTYIPSFVLSLSTLSLLSDMSSTPSQRAVAPLPSWPLDGIDYCPKLHYTRVLRVVGCRVECPGHRSFERPYFSSAFANAVDEDGYQIHDDAAQLVSAQGDYWAGQDRKHDHPVDADIVYPYPRIHPFEFPLSRAVRVFSRSTGRSTVLHVADLHIRWSEIRQALADPSFMPGRYSASGYPFNTSYFRAVCSLFELRIPRMFPTRPLLVHRPSGLRVSLITYDELFHRVAAFHVEDYHLYDPVGRVLRLPPTEFLYKMHRAHGCWWLHSVTAVAEVRAYVLAHNRRVRSVHFDRRDTLDFPLSDLPYPFTVDTHFDFWV